MKQLQLSENYNKGQMTLIAVISLSAILVVVTMAQFFIGYSEYSQSTVNFKSDQALVIAEAGLENGIYEYNISNTYNGGIFSTPIGSATVQVSPNNTPNPPQVTIKSIATYQNITRSETSIFQVSQPPQISNEAAFAQNNIYSYNTVLNGEIFTNNDLNLTNTTVNGDLFGAGKGNGQKSYLTTVNVNKVNGANGNINFWDPTWLQNNTIVAGNANFHTSLHVDGSSSVTGSQTKQSVNFIPPIANPVFNFTQAQVLATQKGTYYTSPSQFNSYLASIGTTANGVTTYNLPSGIYFVDCIGCFFPFILGPWDGGGNTMNVTGNNVSIISNSSLFDLASLSITSPYQIGSTYYPVLATNGDQYLLNASPGANVTVSLGGLVYATGSINAWGITWNTKTVIDGGAWAGSQLNLYNNILLTYNKTYLQNTAGFGFAASLINSLSWEENP